MQTGLQQGALTPRPHAPGSFSAALTSASSSRIVDFSSSDDSASLPVQANQQSSSSASSQNANALSPGAPPRSLASVTSHSNASSTTSLQNFSRPSINIVPSDLPLRNGPPLTANPSVTEFHRGHSRKHSYTRVSFEAFFPTATSSNLGSMANVGNTGLSASQIAAQAAMQHKASHMRQRSQTVPIPQQDLGAQSGNTGLGIRKVSKGPTSPPLLSLTEASGPKDPSFGGQVYHNGLLGGHTLAPAQTAASVVFPKSPGSSPGVQAAEFERRVQPDKPIKFEKPSKVKLFSRPGKIGISKEKTGGALASPKSISSSASMYSMANSSSATIRQIETQQPEKDKEKHKHNFLSRQKHKLSKDDHHLPLSSAASNSKPVDPSAPSSLYNFNLPPSPGPSTASFAKSMSGLDLRHGGRALREKKKEEKSEGELSHSHSNDWPGPSSLGSAGGASYLASSGGGSFGYASSLYGVETQDLGKYGLNNMTPDDAWPFLKAKLLIVFEGEDLRLPVEDFNRLVSTHIQRCIQKRAPTLIVEDLRDLLHTGFSYLDHILRQTPDDRLIPHLVEMWLFTFTSILPYMQAIFLPLDLEFSGHGPLMSSEVARDFWGALPNSQSSTLNQSITASQVLEVRRIVLIAYRDTVILPRFDTLKTIFSRLSLESMNLALPTPVSFSSSDDSFSGGRPSTAMSLDPSLGSYGSQATTLLGEGSGNRSRTISNVSYSSDQALSSNAIPPPQRPFTPNSTHPSFGSKGDRERVRDVEDGSRQLTETVGRMLQCMSVLASVGNVAGVAGTGGGDEDAQGKMEELCRGLKLNWLGRGRMGRNRRGLVGARVPGGVRREDGQQALAVGSVL